MRSTQPMQQNRTLCVRVTNYFTNQSFINGTYEQTYLDLASYKPHLHSHNSKLQQIHTHRWDVQEESGHSRDVLGMGIKCKQLAGS